MCMPPLRFSGGKLNKLAARYKGLAIYLGILLGTNEFFVGGKEGVSRASSFKQLPVVQRYDVDTFNEFQEVLQTTRVL